MSVRGPEASLFLRGDGEGEVIPQKLGLCSSPPAEFSLGWAPGGLTPVLPLELCVCVSGDKQARGTASVCCEEVQTDRDADPGPCFSPQVPGGGRLAEAAYGWQQGEQK